MRRLQSLCRKPRRVATAVQYPNGQILSPVSRRDPLRSRVDEPVWLELRRLPQILLVLVRRTIN